MQGNKLYVGNLAYSITNEQLEELFSQYGTVASVNIITDRDTGRAKGFGFVEMSSSEEAGKAQAPPRPSKILDRATVSASPRTAPVRPKAQALRQRIPKPTHCANGSAKPTHCANGSVKPTHCANGSVKPTHCANGSAKPTHCANGSVKPTHCANGSVKPTHCANGSAKPTHCANGSAKPTHCAAWAHAAGNPFALGFPARRIRRWAPGTGGTT